MAVKQVVTPSNLGLTIKAGHLAATKYDVNIDGITLVANGSGVISTSLDPALVTALITLSGVAGGSTNLGTFTGTVIPDNTTVKAALQALETAFQTTAITGQFLGSAATFAALPTVDALGAPASNGDWAVLTAQDGGNLPGIYVTNGTAYSFVIHLPTAFVTAANAISPKADNATGAIGSSLEYAREDHKHPAQSPSADATNLIVAGTDGLHKVTTASVLALHTAADNLQDAFGVSLGWIHPTTNM